MKAYILVETDTKQGESVLQALKAKDLRMVGDPKLGIAFVVEMEETNITALLSEVASTPGVLEVSTQVDFDSKRAKREGAE